MTRSLPLTLVQVYNSGRANGTGFRSQDFCDFAVKPEDGRDVNGFSCMVKFQQEDDHQEYSIYLNPGFTPLKVEERICNSRGSLDFIDYTD